MKTFKTKTKLTETIARLNQFAQNGGPEVWEYQEFDYLLEDLSTLIKSGKLGNIQRKGLLKSFGPAFSNSTMQGFAFNKPYGYSGDFEIIERIYNWYICPDKKYEKWDLFWQNHAAARAVRNRKEFFIGTLGELFSHKEGSVLNLASGPCSELKEFFSLHPESKINFDCIDMDPHAIQYAKTKLEGHLDQVHFLNQNIFKFVPKKKYDLIWSAGLFDYFNEKAFAKLLARFKENVNHGGRILIGNFDHSNPSKSYMELFDWNLNHRSEAELISIAEAVFNKKDWEISVKKEREGVNLFLEIKKLLDY